MSISEKLLKWRRKQQPSAIMSPETFEKIKRKAEAKGKYRNPVAVAGKAYWQAAKAKYHERMRKGQK